MGKKKPVTEVLSQSLDLTDPDSVHFAEIEMAESARAEYDKIVIQEGESPWRLITATRNNVVDRSSLMHAMEIGSGVLVKVSDLKGNGGTSVTMCYISGKRIEKDLKDSDLYKIVDY